MILLHRLRTQNFKQLAEVSLHFPEQGTILVEGLNEAGKSSLFEAVFFALYGRTLVPDQDYHIADLKSYGADEMRVDLDFSIDGRFFSISRGVRSNHKATLICPGAEGETETIRTLTAIADRLKEEMRLSAEALLNTCFVEQKGLERLESLSARERRETVNELLNLRVLTAMEAEYQVSKQAQDQLRIRRQRVRIAELDARLPQLQEAARAARRCLLYCRLLQGEEQLQELRQWIEKAQARQAAIKEQRHEIRAALEAAERLKARIRAIQGDLAVRVREWDEALRQQESASQRVRDLEALAARIPEEEARLRHLERLRERLEELEGLEIAAERAEEELRQASERLAHRDAVEEMWRSGEEELGRFADAQERAKAELAGAEQRLGARRLSARRVDRLILLQQHLAAWDRAARTVEGLYGQFVRAREKATLVESSVTGTKAM